MYTRNPKDRRRSEFLVTESSRHKSDGRIVREYFDERILLMDDCQISVNTFDKAAETYVQKYFDSDLYNDSYRIFCSKITKKGGSVLDVACGPGNVANFIVRERPDLNVTGIDLAPHMIQMAISLVPKAKFLIHDCRKLPALGESYDGIAYAFGLNYLNQDDAEQMFDSISKVLVAKGTLYLSASLGDAEKSGLHTTSNGNQIYAYYRSRLEVERLVTRAGMTPVYVQEIASPANAPIPTTDLVLVACRG